MCWFAEKIDHAFLKIAKDSSEISKFYCIILLLYEMNFSVDEKLKIHASVVHHHAGYQRSFASFYYLI